MTPRISVTLLDVSSGAELDAPLPWTPIPLIAAANSAPITIRIRRSQCVVQVALEVPEGQEVAMLRNGTNWQYKRSHTLLTAQFLLADDLEHHTFACVAGGKHEFAAELEVVLLTPAEI